MRHSYSATWTVKSADEAEAWARSSCDAYFGSQPYKFSVSAEEQRTLDGRVHGYRVMVDAYVRDEEDVDHPLDR